MSQSSPKITPQDLEFLVYNKAALRYKHSFFDAQMQEEGQIKGDAYSLSYPREWHPPSESKARDFETSLKNLMHSIFRTAIFGREGEGVKGTLLLLTGIDGAHEPVRDKLYPGPFYPVGASNTFTNDQVAGRIPVNADMLTPTAELNLYESLTGHRAINQLPRHVIEQVRRARDGIENNYASYLTGQVIDSVKAAAAANVDQTAQLIETGKERMDQRTRMQRWSR